jgi:hypothetical protein
MFLEGRKVVLKSPLDQHFHLVKMDNLFLQSFHMAPIKQTANILPYFSNSGFGLLYALKCATSPRPSQLHGLVHMELHAIDY